METARFSGKPAVPILTPRLRVKVRLTHTINYFSYKILYRFCNSTR